LVAVCAVDANEGVFGDSVKVLVYFFLVLAGVVCFVWRVGYAEVGVRVRVRVLMLVRMGLRNRRFGVGMWVL
jgi:hypothetical protein